MSSSPSTTVPSKTTPVTEVYNLDDDNVFIVGGQIIDGYTKADQIDMHRMGKQQELMRNFRLLSAMSFTVLVQATWEFILIANTQGLTDGGTAGLFWSFIWTFLGFGIVMLSLAEMASMAPISGGQYHWVSEFAPAKYQKFLSYMTGWLSTLSWQAGTASGSFLTGTLIQGWIKLNNPEYKPQNWQGTLLVVAMVLVLFVANIWGARSMPIINNFLLLVHVFGFFAVIIVLWTMAPRNSAEKVFTEFTNSGGWSSIGVSLVVGQISAIYGFTCSDATAHMAEEVKDAGMNVPKAMVWSFVLNGFLGLFFVVTYLFCLPSVADALSDPTGFPFLYVFRNAVSVGGVNILTVVVLLLAIASNIAFNASTSRQTFAFARDNGLPFPTWIGRVHPTLQIPANAIALTCTLTVLLSLINIGSSAAFNAIISLQIVALMASYCISISCVLYRRLTDTLPRARWSLGRLGVPVNVLGIAYAAFAFFWCFWPNTTPVAADTFNWAPVLFVSVLACCVLAYWLQGRKVYVGPVMQVEGEGGAHARTR